MNRLRELLDQPRVFAIETDAGGAIIKEHDTGALFAEARNAAENAVCFWLGDLDRVCQSLAVIPELCRLPYQTCWFESEIASPEGPVVTGLLIGESDGLVHAVSFTRIHHRWYLDGVAHGSLEAATMTMSDVDDASGIQLRHNIYAAKAFLSALHCSNVKRVEHAPTHKLQKVRAKRGKAPLFSYWTLQLDGRSEQGADRGGTHASPRVHLRRGHPRQYSPGMWTWVQAHAVGNKSRGVVHKDYSACPALLVPAR